MARYNRKKIKKIRKSHIGMSIFALISISVLGTVLLAMLLSTVCAFLVKAKTESDANKVMALADNYNILAAEDPEEAYKVLDLQKTPYFIRSSNKEFLHQYGLNTCNFDNSISYDEISSDSEVYDYKLRMYGDIENGILDPVFLLKDETSLITLAQGLLFDESNLVTETYDDTVSISYDTNGKIDLPYWIAAQLEDGGMIFCRGGLSIKTSDLIFVVIMTATLGLLIVVVVVCLFINVIVNFVDQQRMKKLLFMDNVTNNHNWIRFYLEAGELLEKFGNRKKKYAIVNLVFVKFRNFVLCHSVEEGDVELAKVYNVIRSSIGKKDLCGHDNSSSFAILIRYEDENELRMNIQSIISKLSKINDHHKFSFQAGVELIPASQKRRKDVGVDLLYNNACAARMTLESTDESGIAFFDKKLVEDHKWIDKIHEHQQEGIDNEEFIVYYQPKYDPRTNELVGAEALVRWQSKELGFIAPGRFIPTFEENGFITELDHYMLRHVARDQKKWLDQGLKCVTVSVNVSRAHFIEEDLAEQIRDIVASEGCPPELVEVELTESAFFDNKTVMLATIGRLKEYGFSVSMDDFGSGYSSLNSLKDLPLDVLKLDAGFFQGLSDNGRGEIVVSEAIKLAKNLQMKTVAEGVEDKEQVDFLASEGCDMIQGFYYAKPMPADEYMTRMSGGSKPENDASATDNTDAPGTPETPDTPAE